MLDAIQRAGCAYAGQAHRIRQCSHLHHQHQISRHLGRGESQPSASKALRDNGVNQRQASASYSPWKSWLRCWFRPPNFCLVRLAKRHVLFQARNLRPSFDLERGTMRRLREQIECWVGCRYGWVCCGVKCPNLFPLGRHAGLISDRLESSGSQRLDRHARSVDTLE